MSNECSYGKKRAVRFTSFVTPGNAFLCARNAFASVAEPAGESGFRRKVCCQRRCHVRFRRAGGAALPFFCCQSPPGGTQIVRRGIAARCPTIAKLICAPARTGRARETWATLAPGAAFPSRHDLAAVSGKVRNWRSLLVPVADVKEKFDVEPPSRDSDVYRRGVFVPIGTISH